MKPSKQIEMNMIRCEILRDIFREIQWRMETAEEQLQTAKESQNYDVEDQLNARIEILTELAKHIGKF